MGNNRNLRPKSLVQAQAQPCKPTMQTTDAHTLSTTQLYNKHNKLDLVAPHKVLKLEIPLASVKGI